MIREYIVNNFFSDIVIHKSNELQKILIKDNENLRKMLHEKEYPTIRDSINNLRGRRITEEDQDDLKMILEYNEFNKKEDKK